MVDLYETFWYWVNERHTIYLRRAGTPTELERRQVPFRDCNDGFYTDDPILREYRFCNVFRELDRVTVWIRKNIREPYADHPNLWLMLAIARTINWPDTLDHIMKMGAWPDKQTWRPARISGVLDEWAGTGKKIYTGAYMIRAESDKSKYWYHWTKQRYIAEIVIGRLWEGRLDWMSYLDKSAQPDSLSPYTPTLHGAWSMFQDPWYIGWGPFMAYQVVVDMRHTRYLCEASDINTFAALGPGSKRGLNRLKGLPVNAPLSQDEGLGLMRDLWASQEQYRAPWVPEIELSDIQNCLCEFDKYMRAKLGEGRPRAKYVPGRGY